MQALLALETFNSAWLIGLAAFGLHLIVLGYITITSRYAPRLLGYVLITGGLAYTVDTAAHTLLSTYNNYETVFMIMVAVPAIIAEGWFGLWLLLRAGKGQHPGNKPWQQERPMTAVSNSIETSPRSLSRPIGRWEGQLFGGLVLAAFLLYGVGSSMADEPIGLILVTINSLAVAVVGVLGHRLLGERDPGTGVVYLGIRVAEAALLAGGIFLHVIADIDGADNTGYLLAMIALGAGSVPFWHAVRRGLWLSYRFAAWGIVGYLALAIGALLELTTGREIAIIAAIPGGLFELAVGVYLVARGFNQKKN